MVSMHVSCGVSPLGDGTQGSGGGHVLADMVAVRYVICGCVAVAALGEPCSVLGACRANTLPKRRAWHIRVGIPFRSPKRLLTIMSQCRAGC